MPEPIPESVRLMTEAIFRGRKIDAIKHCRKFTGWGLKEAKAEVERLEASLRAEHPEKFVAAPRKGCFGAAASLCICLGALVYVLSRR
jgi:hypothetical protein